MALVSEMKDFEAVPTPRFGFQDRVVNDLRERDTGRSNFVAFLLGGVVIAGGLFAFLYYDNNPVRHGDDIVTGSIGRTELSGAPPAPNIRIPSTPRPSGSTTPN